MILSFLLFFCSSTVYSEYSNTTEICSNGVKPGNACQLVPSSGYECKNTNSSVNWCESFNGTHKCCEKSTKQCKDRSQFCKMTRHLCRSKSDFRTMKSKCEATCGFCGIDTFEEAGRVQKRIEDLARGQECDLPRKCVYPKEKMLNLTTTSSEINVTSSTLVIDPIIAYRSKLNWNETTISPENTTTPVDLKTILQTTFSGGSTANLTLKTTRRPRTINTDSNESLKTWASSKIRENSTKTSVTLPKSFNSTTVRRVTLEELKTTRDTMPKITTAEPSSLVTSLSKTVIRGTCFDEYTYCREFTSLCSHPAFSEVMASHCSLSCGRCDEVERVEEGKEDCEDMTTDCRGYYDLCGHSRYKSLMEKYCPKTCGHCVPLCRDRHQNCPQFFDDGFCNDTMYTQDERKFLCGATCLMC